MLKPFVAFVIIAVMVLGGKGVVAQDDPPQPGEEAAGRLPDAGLLGAEWTQADILHPNAFAGEDAALSPDLFPAAAAGVYKGPAGSTILMANLRPADDRVVDRAAWMEASVLLQAMVARVELDTRVTDALNATPPPGPCVESYRVQGMDPGLRAPVGATMCVEASGDIWIFFVSGTVNDVSGVVASDGLAGLVIGDGVFATPAAVTDGSEITSGTVMGDPNAPVHLVFYADFQCPFCKQFDERDLPLIIENFVDTGDVRVEWRPLPIISSYVNAPVDSDENESMQSAEAAMCAADQNQFWPYLEALYAAQGAENSGVYTSEMLKATAADLDLDAEQFAFCLDSGEKEPAILAMFDEAIALGVRGTPTFLINDQLVNYTAEGYDRLEVQLNQALDGEPVET